MIVVFQKNNGMCGLVVPSPESMAKEQSSGMSADEALAAIAVRAIIKDGGDENAPWLPVDEKTLPQRELRNAWRFNDGVTIDFNAAADLVRQRIKEHKRRDPTQQEAAAITSAAATRDAQALAQIVREAING